MAVLEELGVGVSIQVDKEDLREWPDPNPPEFVDAGPQTEIVSKYIMSQDEQEYIIHVSTTKECSWIPHDGHIVECRPIVDGDKVPGGKVLLREPGRNCHLQGARHFGANGSVNLRKFKFSAIKIVDDLSKTRIGNDIELAKGLGQVVVRIWRSYHRGVSRRGSSYADMPIKGFQSEIAEEALKGQAISHGTSYSEPRRCKERASKQLPLQAEHADHHPMAIFVFKYRSEGELNLFLDFVLDRYETGSIDDWPAALRKEMVIPRTPEPSPEPERDDIEEMSMEDLRRELRRHRGQEEIRVKRELDLDSDEEKESPPRPFKGLRRSDGPNRVIDPTND